jgi:uncharacterized membrane protein YphA (DoxX/SURF4 family)
LQTSRESPFSTARLSRHRGTYRTSDDILLALRVTLGAAAFLAGLDKFFNLLAD